MQKNELILHSTWLASSYPTGRGIFQFSSTSWGWQACESYVIQIFWSNWRLKVTIPMLIELWHFNSKRIKKEILTICVWDESSKLRLGQWQHILELETYIIDTGDISYGCLGTCHMWRAVFGESGINFGRHHEGRKSFGGKTILERGSDPRRRHGIAPLDKCHYNFLVPLFWLQFSRILLGIKKHFNP